MLSVISAGTQKNKRIVQCRLRALCSDHTEHARTVCKALLPLFFPLCAHKCFKIFFVCFQEQV